MARKGYRQRKSGKNNGNHDVLGITLVVISLFLLLCIAIPPILSIVSRAVFNIMLGVFGIFSYPLCIIVFLLGAFILTKRTFVMSKKAFVCTVLIAVFAMIILQLASTHAFLKERYVDYIADVYTAKYSAGGVILGTVAFGLKTALTEIGCYVIFSLAVVVTVVVLTDLIPRLRSRKGSVVPVAAPKPQKSGFDVKGEPQRVVSVETAPGLFVGTIERAEPPIQTETGRASEIPVKEKRSVTDYSENPVIERNVPQFDGDDKPLSEARFTLYGDSDVIGRQEIEEFGKQQAAETETPVVAEAVDPSENGFAYEAAQAPTPAVEPYERVNADARAVQPKKIVHPVGTSDGRSDKPEIFFPIEKKAELNDEGIENIDDIKARLQKAAKERKMSAQQEGNTQTFRSATETRGASFVVPEYGAPPRAEEDDRIIIPSDTRPQAAQPVVQAQPRFLQSDQSIAQPKAESVEDRFLRSMRQEPVRVESAVEPEPDVEDDIVDAYAMRTMDQPTEEPHEEEDVNPDDIIDGTHSTETPPDGILVGGAENSSRGPSLVLSDEPAVDLSEKHDMTSDIISGGDMSGMYVAVNEEPAAKPTKRQKNNAPLENQITIDGMLKEKAEGTVVMPPKRRKKYNYMPPPIDLLKIYDKNEFTEDELNANAQILESVVSGFLKTQVKVIAIVPGPQVTRYEIEVPSGVPVKSIEARSADIAYELAAVSGIRVEAPIPGKRAVGIEVPVPDSRRSTVGLREIIDSAAFAKAKSPMTFAVGKDLSGDLVLCDLEKVPHLLMAGQTGSGKSAGLNGLIISLLYKSSPDDLRFILVDPKRVEFSKYRGMPHLLFEKIVTEPTEALNSLKWACNEMERRYTILQKYSCSKISEYNALPDVTSGAIEKLPHIVIIIDELANLMQSQVANDIESKISSIAALARAAGIHLIVATQRPSADVITGTIKVNLSSRIAFKVGSQIDSRIILESNGAEALSGQGDMLFYPVDASSARRVQGSFVGGDEVVSVISYLKEHFECDFDEEAEKFVCGSGEGDVGGGGSGGGGNSADPLLPRILALAINSKMISVSVVQRRFSIGYARAARIIDYMEEMGYVGPNTGNNKGRDVLLTREQYIEKFGDDVDDN